MKKLFMMAIMAACTSAACAQADVAKAILKAKTYAEAENMLKTGEAAMDAENKAKAYNKMTELAMKEFSAEEGIMEKNNVAKQLDPNAKEEAYDKPAMYEAGAKALVNAMKCDEFDNQPNAKGKVAPKFHKKNQENLNRVLLHMLTAGQESFEAQDFAGALKYYGAYVDAAESSLFAGMEMPASVGEVARVCALYAFNNKNMEAAHHYCDVAIAKEDSHKDGVELKIYLSQQGLETKADSIAAIKTLEKLYTSEPTEQVFDALANAYAVEGTAKQNEFIEQHLAANPNSADAWAMKGQNLINEKKYTEAIESLKKSNAIEERAIVCTYIGFCYAAMGNDEQDEATQKKKWEEAIVYLEQARKLDPDQMQSRWGYTLYACYYNLYGENDSRTKEIESVK